MGKLFSGLAGLFLTKKRIIGWLAAVVIAATALATGMSFEDVKEAIVGAPVISVPTPSPTPDPQLVKELDGK